jgi:AraC family transcriptional regulator, exoenzyme S synthesis regulatory protein ExsA
MAIIKKIPSQIIENKPPQVEAFLYQTAVETEKCNVQFSDNKIVFVIKGRKEIYAESEKVVLEKNQGFLLKAGKYLMTERFNNDRDYQSISINFSNSIVSKLLPQIKFKANTERSFQMLKIDKSHLIDTFVNSLQTYFQFQSNEINWDTLLEMKLNELFVILFNSKEREEFLNFIESLHSKNKISLELLMETHFKESLTLPDLAFLAGTSLSTLKRQFAHEMNLTPHEWIVHRRLEEAKFLLTIADKNISDVCYECGFENLSHFIKLFKSNFNKTPSQFRNERLIT